MTTIYKKSSQELRSERRSTPEFADDLLLACLWPRKGENLGTALRTCDAVGATLVVPKGENATRAIRKGNTIGLHNSPVIEIEEGRMGWLYDRRDSHRIIGIELAHNATPLKALEPAITPTIIVVGHEITGIPQAALHLCADVVEIPMQGVGNSLNVAVAGSLVLYKLRGWV